MGEARPHRAWLTINGEDFPLLSGSASQTKTKKSSTFSATAVLTPDLEQIVAGLGDNEASVSVLSGGEQKALVTGEIDSARLIYIKGVANFSGRCKSAKLHSTRSAEKWQNKAHTDIVKDIASRIGLSPNLGQFDALKAGRLLQLDWSKLTDGVSYATVLHKAAEILGARWWVDPKGTLHFQPEGSPQGTFTLTYQEIGGDKTANFSELEINRNIQAGKPIKVKVKSFHPGQKKSVAGTYTIGGNGSTVEYGYHLAGHSQDHVDAHAKARCKEIAGHELQLTAQLPGDPSIDVAMALELQGTAFAQTFEMDSISHQFGMRGHTMSISAKSAKKGRS
jgi:hypothetical protein